MKQVARHGIREGDWEMEPWQVRAIADSVKLRAESKTEQLRSSLVSLRDRLNDAIEDLDNSKHVLAHNLGQRGQEIDQLAREVILLRDILCGFSDGNHSR